MSAFTRFSAVEQLQYDKVFSRRFGKDIYAVIPGFRYYIGHENSDKYVDVETGFKTDGATVPRFLWWLLPPVGEYSQACSLHDKLCQTYEITQVINGIPTQVKINRKEIDRILKEAMEVLEVTQWKQDVIMAGVNVYRITTNPTTPKSLAKSFSVS
jgi:hypothetical protein